MQKHPAGQNVESYSSHFAASCKCYDLIAAALTVSVGSVIALSRTLQEADCHPHSGNACGQDPLLNSFPESSTQLLKALWVIRRLPWLPWYLGLYHGLQAYAIFLLLNWVVAIAAWKQPRWYLNGGRGILITAIRILLGFETFCSLILLGSQRSPVQIGFTSVAYGQGGTARALLWKTVMWQAPLALQLKIVGPDLFLMMSVSAWQSSTPASSSQLLFSVLLHAICGAAFPMIISALKDRSMHKSFSLRAEAAGDVSFQDSTGSTVTASKPGVLVESAEVSGETSALQASKPSVLYQSRARCRLISIKVRDHDAYGHRQQIATSVQKSVCETYFTANHSGLIQCQVSSWQGCLQLLVKITEELALDDSNTSTNPHTCDLMQLIRGSLPADVVSSHFLVHSPCDGILMSTDNISHERKLLADSSDKERSEGLVPAQLLNIKPFVVDSGLLESMPLIVESTLSTDEDMMERTSSSIGSVEVVACFKQQDKEVVQSLKLELFQQRTRLSLPAAISPGPFSVHILSCQPGQEGALLGSLTTVAMPPPAAQELRHMLNLHAADPQLQEGFVNLLQDMATVCSMTGHGELQEGAPAQDMLQDLLHYFSSQDMPNCSKQFTHSALDSPSVHTLGVTTLCPPKEQLVDPASNAFSALGSPSCMVNSSCPISALLVDYCCDTSAAEHVTVMAPSSPQHGSIAARSSRKCSAQSAEQPGTRQCAVPSQEIELSCFQSSLSRVTLSWSDCLKGFADPDLKREYVQYRGGSSTLAADWVALLYYVLLAAVTLYRKDTYMLHGVLWFTLGDAICLAVQGILVTPLRPALASNRSVLTCGGKAFASCVKCVALAMRWVEYKPEELVRVTRLYFDITFCLRFALVYQAQFSVWLVAAAAAECAKFCLAFAPGIGLRAAAARMLPVHLLGVVLTVQMDMWARTSFLKQKQRQKLGDGKRD